VDADGLIAACATRPEQRAARRAGYRAALVGVCVRRGAPSGGLVSFGVAGGMNGSSVGTVIDATRVVDEHGRTLWEGPGLGVGRPGTILAMTRLVDDPADLRRLHEQTGADAVDMESGVLAATGRLRGCVRAISDTPTEPLGPLAQAVTPDGRPRPFGFVKAVVTHPRGTMRALANVRRALQALEAAR
jgi:8-oxo-dGTP pyrophosphatase MutT (NUDIX family)